MAFYNYQQGYGGMQNQYGMYQPYSYGTPAYMPQSVQQQAVGAQSAVQSQPNGIPYVNGKEGAKAFNAPPNSTVLLMDSDSPSFFIKIFNNVGQGTIRRFSFQEIPFDSDPGKESAKEEKTAEYITAQDFKSFTDKIFNKIDTLKSSLDKRGRADKEN